jgi:hypothetical protein
MTDRHYVPVEIRQELGNIVIEWSKIEAHIAELLTYLLNANKGAMHVINQEVSSATQLKWIRILAADKFKPETMRHLSVLFDRIDAARQERNSYVHGLWTEGPAGETESTAIVETINLGRSEIIKRELVNGS